MQAEYLVKQLNEFMTGKRKNDIMAPIVATLKPSDVAPLANYFAAQKMSPGVVTDKPLAEAGRRVFMDGNEDTGVPACAGCHQNDGLGRASGGSDIARFPRLAGQNAEYLSNQLLSFKDGARANDPARIMRAVAKRLTEQEIKAVAEFIAGGL
jgi:cytochrome c553